jgi:hypothetical protein
VILTDAADVRRVAEEFLGRHNVSPTEEAAIDFLVIYVVATMRTRFDEEIGRGLESGAIAQYSLWGALRWIMHRGLDHADAGLIALAADAVPTTEVISRALLEAALNLM